MVFSKFIPEDLFWENLLTIQYTLGNKIKITILVNTCAIGFEFIDKNFAETICKKLEIQPQCLTKPKPIQGFDNKTTKSVTHAIYLTFSMGKHTESLSPLLITKLGQYSMILSYLWIKKHRVLLDIVNNFITFFPESYCIHLRAFLSSMPWNLERTEIISTTKQEDIILKQILKREIDEKLDDFSSTIIKILSKKRRLLNAFKRKSIKRKSRSGIVIISSLSNSSDKPLLTSTLTWLPNTDIVNVAIIGADAYCATCKLKGAYVFAVSMRDLEFQVAKEARPETDLKSVVLEEYHNLLDVFSKKDLDTLLFHQKDDHKIILKKEQKHGHASLYKMSP